MEASQTGNKGLFKRAWAHLTRPIQGSSQVSWRVRAMIVLAIMFTMVALLVFPTQYAVQHRDLTIWVLWTAPWCIFTWYMYQVRRYERPRRAMDPIDAFWGDASYSLARGIHRWRRFLIANLLVVAAYFAAVAVADTVWSPTLVREAARVTAAIVLLVCLFLGLVGMVKLGDWVHETFGRRAPYEVKIRALTNAIAEWKAAVADRDKIIKDLGAERAVALDAVALAIMRIRGSKGLRKDDQIAVAVLTGLELVGVLKQLVPDEEKRNTLLGKAFAKLHPDTAETPAEPQSKPAA